MSRGPAAHWTRLGLEPTTDNTSIRRAYARELKLVHPEEDPAGFQALRAAYEAALQEARWMQEDAALEVDSDYAEEDDTPLAEGETFTPIMQVFRVEPATPHAPEVLIGHSAPEPQGSQDSYSADDFHGAPDAALSPNENDPAWQLAQEAAHATENALRTVTAVLAGPRLEDSETRRHLDAAVDAIENAPIDSVGYYTDALIHVVLDADSRVDQHLTHLQRRLGWEHTDAVGPWNQQRERLAQRIDGRDFLLSVRIPNAPLAPAWNLLNEATPWRRTVQLMRHPKRAGLALDLLARMEMETPHAVEALPAQSVDYWNRWRDKGVWRPWVNNWIATFVTLGLLGTLGGDSKEPGLFWLGLAAATGVAGALWLYGVERPAKQGLALPEWLRPATAITMFLWPVGVAAFEPLPAGSGAWLAGVFLPLAAGAWVLAVTRPYVAPGTQRVGLKDSLLVNLFWLIGVGLWLLALGGTKKPDVQPPSPTLLGTLAMAVLAMAAVHGEMLRAWFTQADAMRFRLLTAMAAWCVVLFGWLHFSAGLALAPASWLALALLTSLGMRSLLYPGIDAVKFRGWMSAFAFAGGWLAHGQLSRLTGAPSDYGPAAALLGAAVFEAAHHAWALRRDIRGDS